MALNIKVVPHPARRQVTLPDGRKLHHCDKCNEDMVQAKGHKKWQPVLCDRCQQPTEPKMVVHIKDQCAIEVEGKIVGLCHNGPNGFIAPTQKLDEFIWAEVKRVVDKHFGGAAVLRNFPPTFAEVAGVDDEPTEIEEGDE